METIQTNEKNNNNNMANFLHLHGIKYYLNKQYDNAFSVNMENANNEYTKSYHQLGILYMNGLGCEQNYMEALHWLYLSIETNSIFSEDSKKTIEMIYRKNPDLIEQYQNYLAQKPILK